jgi:hypothetical protein
MSAADVQVQKVRLAEVLRDTLRDNGINHAFVHGLEDPGRLGRDLDLLVQTDQLASSVRSVSRRLSRDDWRVRIHRRWNGHYWCFASPRNSNTVLEFDLFPLIRWGPSILVDRPEPLVDGGGFFRDPWAAFVKRVLVQLLAHGSGRFRQSPERLGTSMAEQRVAPVQLRRLFGDRAAGHLWHVILQRNIDELGALAPALRRALLVRSLAQPPRETVTAVTDWALNELTTSFARTPLLPVVAIVGSDETKRVSVADALAAKARDRLPAVSVEMGRLRPSNSGLSPAMISRLREIEHDRRAASDLRLVVRHGVMGNVRSDARVSTEELPSQAAPGANVIALLTDTPSLDDIDPRAAEGIVTSADWTRVGRRRTLIVALRPGTPAEAAADFILGAVADWVFAAVPAEARMPGEWGGRKAAG